MTLRLLTLAFAGLFLLSCGNNEPKVDLCDGVACERGACDSDTGMCANPAGCAGDGECLDGFSCADGACVADVACSEDRPCELGECLRGACVNAEVCAQDHDCVAGFRCADNACEVDLCADTPCERGVCNPETGGCANNVVCTEATEAADCLEGHFCYGQSCTLAEEICDDLACRNGVCDAATAECVDADNCEGSDRNCLAGNYCADDDTCQPNVCDAQMTSCPRGVCDPSSGRCENATRCTAATECVGGWSCVDGTCVLAGEECGSEGCPGSQVCTYVEADLAGECQESGDGCVSTLDCAGTRVCRDGECGQQPVCAPDTLEPNDSDAEGVRIADLPGNIADATLCAGDTDVFGFHTDDSPLFRGVLLVDVRVHPEDVGAGALTLELVRPDASVSSVPTDATGAARIAVPVTVADFGEYTIRVKDAGDVYQSGVRYTLYADMLDQSALDACGAATALPVGQSNGNTTSGASFLLGSECTGGENAAGEDVYFIDVVEPSRVDVTVTPAPGTDLTVSIRSRCEVTDDLFCANDIAGAGPETVGTTLQPGRYYVIVQGATPTSGGSYSLSYGVAPIVCGPADATCTTATRSRYCNAFGTGFEQIDCDTTCDPVNGLCARLPNDVCYSATDATGGLTASIAWTDFANDYDPGSSSCVPVDQGTQTDGPDVAYRVDLQPDEVLVANLDLASSDWGSLYLVENCLDLAGTCVAGANDGRYSDEELIYFNTTGAPQTLYLIADLEVDTFSYGTGNISISVHPQICTPGVDQCGGDFVQVCDRFGGSFTESYCTFGCANGVCNPLLNDSCTGAVALDDGLPFTGRIDEYNRDVSPAYNGCTQRSASGPDALFTVTPAAGEIATVTVDADFDVSLLVGTDCANPDDTCVVGSDAISATTETVQFAGDGTTTYTISVDSQFSGAGMFTVQAAKQMPTCVPATNLGCSSGSTLSYCSELGVPVDYTCATTCAAGACTDPTGEVCYDPVVATDPFTVTSAYSGTNDINFGGGVAGACDFGTTSTPGVDHVYAVDLVAGDYLFAEFTSSSGLALMYLLSDCGGPDSCLDRSISGTSGSIVYQATQSERVLVVMDRTSSGTSTLDYTLDLDVRRQDCTPGSPAYCKDASTIAYCDGLGFTRDFACTTSCTGGMCDNPGGDVCVDAVRVNDGDVVTGNWSTGTNSVQPAGPIDGICPFDSGQEADGLEDIYRIDLLAGDLLRVDLTTTWSSALVYILEDCQDTSTCSDINYEGGSGSAWHYASVSGPVYVVVDSTSSFSSSTSYTLAFDVSQGSVCAPNQTWCDLSGNVQVCDGSGSFVKHTYPCPGGCANGACVMEAAADVCLTAPMVPTGTVVYGSFANLNNDVTRTSTGCTGGSSSGPDAVYAVTAGPGDVIHAQLWSWGNEQVELSVLGDCSDPGNTCLAGSGTPDYDYVETHFAPATAGTYYVVADSTSSLADEPFTLFVEVIPTECTPETVVCSANGQSLNVCNRYGLWEDYPCAGGCAAGACGTPSGAICADAIPVVNGSTASGTFEGETNLAPSGTAGTCSFASGETPIGPERIFSVDLKAGDILDASYTSSSSFAILYLMGNCWDEDSCINNTVDGSSGVLRYAAPQDETVFVVMDRTSSASTLTWDLTFTISTPDCTPGSAATCVDADTVGYCDALGFSQTYDCGGTTPTCTTGACATPTGDVCVDAMVLTDGSSVSGTFQGTNDLELGGGGTGACSFPSNGHTMGVDHFFRVDVMPGDILIADYTSGSTSGLLYLMGDCLDGSTCIDHTTTGTAGRLVYTATVAESLYLVIDRTISSSTTLSWTLDVRIAQPSCTPGARACAVNGTTLEWCDEYGLWQTYGCTGTCTAGACDTPTGDACVDPIIATNGSVFTRTYEGTNDSDLGGGTVGQCNFGGDAQPGVDRFFQVDLLAGQTVNASYTTSSGYGVLLLMKDCTEPTSCEDNSAQGSAGSVSYTATAAETVFLVMDRGLSGSTATYDYTLTVGIN